MTYFIQVKFIEELQDRVGRQGTLLCKEINIGYL